MFSFPGMRIIDKTLVTGILAINSLAANAALTFYSSNSVDLVYSSVSNVTWTKDGNLLGSMIAEQGYNTLVNAIVSAKPIIFNTPNLYSPGGAYFLSAFDFSEDSLGKTTWFGAIAFIHYLNISNYGGSNQWRLPSVTDIGPIGCDYSNGGSDCGWNVATNGTAPGDELAELYFSELGSKSYHGNSQTGFGLIDANNVFIHEQRNSYWSSSEYAPNISDAWNEGKAHDVWYFDMLFGEQYRRDKVHRFYSWAINTGYITAVPEPQGAAMLLAGLGWIGLFSRSRKTNKY